MLFLTLGICETLRHWLVGECQILKDQFRFLVHNSLSIRWHIHFVLSVLRACPHPHARGILQVLLPQRGLPFTLWIL